MSQYYYENCFDLRYPERVLGTHTENHCSRNTVLEPLLELLLSLLITVIQNQVILHKWERLLETPTSGRPVWTCAFQELRTSWALSRITAKLLLPQKCLWTRGVRLQRSAPGSVCSCDTHPDTSLHKILSSPSSRPRLKGHVTRGDEVSFPRRYSRSSLRVYRGCDLIYLEWPISALTMWCVPWGQDLFWLPM